MPTSAIAAPIAATFFASAAATSTKPAAFASAARPVASADSTDAGLAARVGRLVVAARVDPQALQSTDVLQLLLVYRLNVRCGFTL